MNRNKGVAFIYILVLLTAAAFVGMILYLQKDHAGALPLSFLSDGVWRGSDLSDDSGSTTPPGTPDPLPPDVNAGPDIFLKSSQNYVTLQGLAADANGGPLSYSWVKLSGGTVSIQSPNSKSTLVTGLKKGVYVFRLIVTDSTALRSADELFVTVGGASGGSGSTTTGGGSSSSGYTIAQVATHNTQANCWIIISGKIYNVTSFISQHPGGASAIISRCGTDATTVFNSNSGGGHNHSSYARSLLLTYYVGPVGTGTTTTTTNPPPSQNIPPFASAGPDQVITLPTNSVVLSGTGSNDSDGTISRYVWTKVTGGTATIVSPSSVVTAINNLVQGSYVFRLAVTDNKNVTATDDIVITVNPEQAPPPPSGYTLAQVAAHSSPSNCWIIISNKIYNVTPFLNSHPGGASVITAYCGQDATVAFHTHGHGSGGTDHSSYAYSLLPAYYVGDLSTTAPPPNTPPLADAGPDESVMLPTNSVVLDGSGSADTDGTIATYAWTKVNGGAATIVTPNEDVTDITGLVAGSYTFRLAVTDNDGATSTDTVVVTVAALPVNASPLADAGVDQTITLPTSSVALDGSNSTDSDGTIATYAWTKVSGGAATITTPSAASTSVTGLVQGSYTFRLTVTDNQGATGADDVVVTVNPQAANVSPSAVAGVDQTITLPTNSVTLNGSGSDSDGTIATYLWTKIAGGVATITSPSTASTTVTGLVAGSYTFRLTVTDNQGATGTDTMNVTVNATPPVNSPPLANAGSDQTITLPTNSVTLNGSGSDSDGTVVAYAWTKVSGGAATITTPSAASTSVTGLVQGPYTFRLTVTDNQGATGTDTMNVTVNAAATPTYTAAQVATHNTQGNCWLIISAKVYGVSSFISQHPGGANAIISRCGTDATTVFNSNNGGGHNHSNYARSLLPTYYLGDLVP